MGGTSCPLVARGRVGDGAPGSDVEQPPPGGRGPWGGGSAVRTIHLPPSSSLGGLPPQGAVRGPVAFPGLRHGPPRRRMPAAGSRPKAGTGCGLPPSIFVANVGHRPVVHNPPRSPPQGRRDLSGPVGRGRGRACARKPGLALPCPTGPACHSVLTWTAGRGGSAFDVGRRARRSGTDQSQMSITFDGGPHRGPGRCTLAGSGTPRGARHLVPP